MEGCEVGLVGLEVWVKFITVTSSPRRGTDVGRVWAGLQLVFSR